MFLMGCTSSNKEDEEFDNSVFWGEWYLNENAKITVLTFDALRFNGVEYPNPSIQELDRFYGNWAYFADSQSLVLNETRESGGATIEIYYQLIQVDKYSMKLREKSLKKTVLFLKIVEKINLHVGEYQDISYMMNHSIIAHNYSSSDNSTVTVDSSGKVTAISPGIAFITISTDVGTLIVQVKVS